MDVNVRVLAETLAIPHGGAFDDDQVSGEVDSHGEGLVSVIVSWRTHRRGNNEMQPGITEGLLNLSSVLEINPSVVDCHAVLCHGFDFGVLQGVDLSTSVS